MFAFLRKLIVPIMATVLVFFLATIVFEWGMNITSTQNVRDTIGVINGEEIKAEIYGRYYSELVRQEEENSQADLPTEKVDELKRRAWNQLVGDVLINQEVQKHNIVVTNQEIFSFLRLYPPAVIQNAPQFVTDGKFDYQKYVSAMANPSYAPMWASLESYVLPELKKYKLQEEIINTIRVSPAEVMDAFLEGNEIVKIGYVNFPSSKIMQTLPKNSTEEMRAYYDSHKDEFKRARRATIQLVLLQKAPSQNDWQRAEYQIREIYDSLRAGSDFADLARIYSQDPGSAEKGGDLGWISRSQMVPAFDSAVWTLKAGEMSTPVKSEFGWHVIKVLDRRIQKRNVPGKSEAIDVDEANAAHILVKVNISQETLDELNNNIKDFAGRAADEGFETVAQEMGYPVQSTAPFGEKDYIQFIGANQEVLNFAFQNDPGTISEPLENSSSYFVAKVATHIPEGIAPFEEVETSINQKLNMEKAKELTQGTAQRAYDAIRTGTPITRAGDSFGYSYAEADSISRNSNLPGIGKSPEVLGTAFALKNIGDVSQPVQYASGSAIITLLGKISPNLEQYNQIQDSLRQAVLTKKQQDIYSRWFDNLLANSKIESYVERFYGGSY